jgi:hypothetical protein
MKMQGNPEKEKIVFGGINLPDNQLFNDVWIINYSKERKYLFNLRQCHIQFSSFGDSGDSLYPKENKSTD